VARKKILIVDDEEGMRDSLTFMLENEGYTSIQTAKNGEVALEQLDRQAYALVITDLEMPKMNGYELMQVVQRRWPNTMVVAITGFGSTESAAECLRRGAFDYITKPFNVEVIMAVIRRALDRFQLATEARAQTEQIAAMAEIARLVNSSLNIQEVYPPFTQEVKRLLAFEVMNIALLDKEHGTLRILATTAPETSALAAHKTIPVDNTRLGEVATSGESCHRDNMNQGGRLLDEDILFQEGIRSFILRPLVVKSKTIGTFMIGSSSSGAYGASSEDVAKQIGGLVATTANNMVLFEQLQSQLTHLRRAQSQLIRSARLAAVGELADGVAHEINNPLSVILGGIQLILRQPDIPLSIREDMEKISASADRIASVIRTFIEFAKPTAVGRQCPVQITDVFESSLLLVQSQFNYAVEIIEIQRVFSSDLPQIMGDEGQLRRAFVAIIHNAFEAMLRRPEPPLEGGHLLRLSARSRVEESDSFVEALIEDTGDGITENHLSRIFEPGFTTKIEKGTVRGLGMGLFSAYGIIDTHGGNIAIESEVGRGTRVLVTLSAV
jgi:two-component system NtrC family sensor kinase